MPQRSLLAFRVLLTIAAGVWFPLRIVLVHEHFGIDALIEAAILSGAVFALLGNWRSLDPEEVVFSVIEALPLVTIFHSSMGETAELLALVRIVMFRHLFRIRDLLDAMDNLHPVMARILPLSVIVPVVMHAVACGWVYLGSGTAGHDPSAWVEYIRAVYWTVTTLATVGYGDISAKSPGQMIYASGTMIAGVAFFGYVLSNVAALLARMDAAHYDNHRHVRLKPVMESALLTKAEPDECFAGVGQPYPPAMRNFNRGRGGLVIAHRFDEILILVEEIVSSGTAIIGFSSCMMSLIISGWPPRKSGTLLINPAFRKR